MKATGGRVLAILVIRGFPHARSWGGGRGVARLQSGRAQGIPFWVAE